MQGPNTLQLLGPVASQPRGRRSPRMLVRPPRRAPAAFRIPDVTQEPLDVVFPSGAPQLFVHEGARQHLQRKLARACGRQVLLTITDNQHSMVRHSLRNGILSARIHHMFLDAPAAVQRALVRYIVSSDRSASVLVGQFINANRHRIRVRHNKFLRLVAKGKHHDLLRIFEHLNEVYFGGDIDALITWGRSRRRDQPKRKTLRMGSYDTGSRIITIHPVLDRAWVPKYFVAFVIYHEMLHQVIGMQQQAGTGRVQLHPPAFRERERLFRHYERALGWEREHTARLLRSA